MIKDEIPRGQLSTIILMTLLERDKYGYEIIDEVLQNTSGKVSIKQPSLYSSLKRMEEQSLISSYWRDSEIGGKRHYYHLTDLGKKHLEKWKNDIPTQYYNTQNDVSNQNHSTEATKVLQQENLFNLEKQNNKQEEVLNDSKQDNAFVQFDLFSNSVILTPPSNDNQNNNDLEIRDNKNNLINNNDILKEDKFNTQSIVINQNPILTSYEKPIEEKSYNFEYVKKTNKSFSESLNSTKYEKKYIEHKMEPEVSTTKDENEYPSPDYTNNSTTLSSINVEPLDTIANKDNINAQKDKVTKQTMQINDTYIASENNNESNLTSGKDIEDCNIIVNKIDIKELKNYMPNNNNDKLVNTSNNLNDMNQEIPKENNKIFEKTDDGVFITERLNPEDMPKPTKWDTRRFEYYISANNVTPDLKKKNNNSNYEDRVKDLYEQSKMNAENQELELIDNKVKFSTYKDLQEFYKEQNIKFKPFEKSLKKTNKDYNMVKINKLNMLTSLSVFAYAVLVSLIFGIVYSFIPGVRFNKPISFIIMPIIVGIYFCYYLVCYLKTPQKRIALDISKYKLKSKYILVSILLIPLILSGNLIAGFTFKNISLYQISIFYPLCFVFTYFVYYFARKLILKSKNLY